MLWYQTVTPRLLQKSVSENFKFPHDITTSSELRIGSGIYFFLKISEYNTSKLTELPQYIKIWTTCFEIINTHKAFNICATCGTDNMSPLFYPNTNQDIKYYI
jgi:hypothetical protein